MKSKIFIGIIAGIAILLSAISICMNISEIVVNDISLVLGFIGVLATFVVISNGVQLWILEGKINTSQLLLENLKNQKRRLYNGMKLVMLNFVYNEIANSKKTSDLKQKNVYINRSFLYLIDIIPMLEGIYGRNGDLVDETKENLDVIINIFLKILNYSDINNGDNSVNITLNNLVRCDKYLERFLPDEYNKLENIQNLKKQIKKHISHYEHTKIENH